ncbi:MAG: D-alanine--D-alanine ligase [Clostridia bacterium]|nr:D-alanine--D-alanine ligase [Clostridia bacterium]
MKITLLCGGKGGERAVSLISGLRVSEALFTAGHRVAIFDIDEVPDAEMLPFLRRADAVFLALHGGAGEGGALQEMLDTAGIAHYTGSAAAAAALAMNKLSAKQAVATVGLPVTPSIIWQVGAPRPHIPYPAVIKPLCGGSSVGLTIAESAHDTDKISPTEPMLIEPLLVGREYSVGVLAGSALPVVEIRPRGGVYDYQSKYEAGGAEELCPAPISEEKTILLQTMALRAFEALGLRDFARIDFKEDGTGTPYFLEANTLPGMTDTSLLPLAAKRAGISFPTLCTRMATLAAARKKQN